MTTYGPKFVLFYGGIEHLEEAKAYVREHGFTSDDVRIITNGEEVMVITKKQISFDKCNTDGQDEGKG